MLIHTFTAIHHNGATLFATTGGWSYSKSRADNGRLIDFVLPKLGRFFDRRGASVSTLAKESD